MDLRTRYLGLDLRHPFVVGASPMADTLDGARRAEDAGAAAIVMRSLFEEQLAVDALATDSALAPHEESFGEALSFSPEPLTYAFGPDEYLERLRRTKEALSIPVLASLNGTTPGGWLEFATLIEEAGADALELNVFGVAIDPEEDAARVEERIVQTVRAVTSALAIPVAVKLSPFFTALPHLALRLVGAGARGLVLFNRFYDPEIDAEGLALGEHATLSSSSELPLRLRWIGILSAQLEGTSLSVTGGVHRPIDAVKALMAGADSVLMVSALLKQGPGHVELMLSGLESWLEEHEYQSLDQLRGSLDLSRAPQPEVYRRGNYLRSLQTWPHGAHGWRR